MKLLANSRKFYDALLSDDDRRRLRDWLGSRDFDSMPIIQVTLPEAKTQSQLGAIWLDFAKVGNLLHCDPTYVYYLCQRADVLQDIWLRKVDNKWHFYTLSGMSKEQVSEAIPRLRDFMQDQVNKAHGEYICINWSCAENVGKPDFEFAEAERN